MSKQYKRVDKDSWLASYYVNCYYLKYAHYFRNPRTFNEIRQNMNAIKDGFKVRGKRKRFNLPDANDDLSRSQDYGKDWKRFTKRFKQYHVHRDHKVR